MSSLGLNRLEGRLFSDSGHLCMVVEIDEPSSMGRISYSLDGERQVKDLPIMEVSRLVASNNQAALRHSSKKVEVKHCIDERDGGFYAKTREGDMGPYPSFEAAESAFQEYIEEQKLTNTPAR